MAEKSPTYSPSNRGSIALTHDEFQLLLDNRMKSKFNREDNKAYNKLRHERQRAERSRSASRTPSRRRQSLSSEPSHVGMEHPPHQEAVPTQPSTQPPPYAAIVRDPQLPPYLPRNTAPPPPTEDGLADPSGTHGNGVLQPDDSESIPIHVLDPPTTPRSQRLTPYQNATPTASDYITHDQRVLTAATTITPPPQLGIAPHDYRAPTTNATNSNQATNDTDNNATSTAHAPTPQLSAQQDPSNVPSARRSAQSTPSAQQDPSNVPSVQPSAQRSAQPTPSAQQDPSNVPSARRSAQPTPSAQQGRPSMLMAPEEQETDYPGDDCSSVGRRTVGDSVSLVATRNANSGQLKRSPEPEEGFGREEPLATLGAEVVVGRSRLQSPRRVGVLCSPAVDDGSDRFSSHPIERERVTSVERLSTVAVGSPAVCTKCEALELQVKALADVVTSLKSDMKLLALPTPRSARYSVNGASAAILGGDGPAWPSGAAAPAAEPRGTNANPNPPLTAKEEFEEFVRQSSLFQMRSTLTTPRTGRLIPQAAPSYVDPSNVSPDEVQNDDEEFAELPDDPEQLGSTLEERMITVITALAQRVRRLEVDLAASIEELKVMEMAAIDRDLKLNRTKVGRDEIGEAVTKAVEATRRDALREVRQMYELWGLDVERVQAALAPTQPDSRSACANLILSTPPFGSVFQYVRETSDYTAAILSEHGRLDAPNVVTEVRQHSPSPANCSAVGVTEGRAPVSTGASGEGITPAAAGRTSSSPAVVALSEEYSTISLGPLSHYLLGISLADEEGLKGARVEAIHAKSPVQGLLHRGDVIVQVNRIDIRSVADVSYVLSRAQPEAPLTLGFIPSGIGQSASPPEHVSANRNMVLVHPNARAASR